MVCLTDGTLTKATRIRDGLEDDQYVCELGHEFGVDWSHGEATEPQWPPTAELRALVANRSES